MNESVVRENFEAGMNQSYSHMFILRDVFSNEDKYFYVLDGHDVDEEVENLTCVDTYRLVAIFNYRTPFDKQLRERKIIEQKNNCFSLKFIR